MFERGGELFNYIVRKKRLTEKETAFLFFQLINGLEYIHSLGIVHRDLKPENLLLTRDHLLKIIDFGLSNYFKENQTELLSTPCGSPCYASPEMVSGKKYDGVKSYNDYKKMLEIEKPKYVLICKSAEKQFEIAKYCINFGIKKIFVEKPMGMNVKESKYLEELSKEKNCKIMVGYMKRFSPLYI